MHACVAQPHLPDMAGEQREWLIDCYRMRADDDATWGGGHLRGLYAEEKIVPDFLAFCLLAVTNEVLPEEV